jgi:hypothetical protein
VFSQFKRVGEKPFPSGGAKLRCDAYEWTPKNPKQHGKFKIRFLSPKGDCGPRLFYVEPLLDLWLTGKPTRFLEEACAYGYKVLRELEPHSGDDQNVYRLCQALFRNRHAGHLQIGRLFSRATDFVSVGPGQAPYLVTPGLGSDDGPENVKSTIRDMADDLLRDALSHAGVVPRKRHYRFSDVLATYESQLKGTEMRAPDGAGGASCAVPIDTLPGRTRLDLLFTDGLTRGCPWDGKHAMIKVRSALIYGPVSADDQALAVRDPEAFKKCLGSLWRAASTRSPKAFDSWLATVREHRYLALIGGTRLKDEAKAEAAAQAQRIYCTSLWTAYERMARCYGALMMLVFLSLCLDDELKLTEEERWLFRQWHFPQLYLAGLPLDFLGKPQLRWVIRTWHRLWGDRVFEPERYDVLTDLLGIYGLMVRTRREADRKQKAAPLDEYLVAVPAAKEDDALWQLERQGPCPQLATLNCPGCGSRLQLSDWAAPDVSDRARSRVWLYCPGCDADREFTINLDELARVHSNGV